MKDKKELKAKSLEIIEKITSGELNEHDAREMWHDFINESEDKMTMTAEMIRFRRMLTEANIGWEDKSEEGSIVPIWRTHFNHRGYKWSVIHGYGTYGGFSRIEKDKGLLEVMSDAINGGDPIGFLTADEVMSYVKGEQVG